MQHFLQSPLYADSSFVLQFLLQLQSLCTKSLETISSLNLAVRSPWSSSPRFWNLWYDILILSHFRLNWFLSSRIILGIRTLQNLANPIQKYVFRELLRFFFFRLPLTRLVFVSSIWDSSLLSRLLPALSHKVPKVGRALVL